MNISQPRMNAWSSPAPPYLLKACSSKASLPGNASSAWFKIPKKKIGFPRVRYTIDQGPVSKPDVFSFRLPPPPYGHLGIFACTANRTHPMDSIVNRPPASHSRHVSLETCLGRLDRYQEAPSTANPGRHRWPYAQSPARCAVAQQSRLRHCS